MLLSQFARRSAALLSYRATCLNRSTKLNVLHRMGAQGTLSGTSRERETFTIRLKSLVLNGNGCTVYNSVGQIVYRVANYDNTPSNEIYLMDLKGNVTCSIIRKIFQMIGCWNGHINDCPGRINEKPWFQMRKKRSTRKGILAYEAIVGLNEGEENIYKIEGERNNKQSFKIIDDRQCITAEKQSLALS